MEVAQQTVLYHLMSYISIEILMTCTTSTLALQKWGASSALRLVVNILLSIFSSTISPPLLHGFLFLCIHTDNAGHVRTYAITQRNRGW